MNKHIHWGLNMFIYKITITPINKVYIGLDTKPSYKLSRWKQHCKEALGRCKAPLHKAMKQYGLDNCVFEILEDNISTIGALALSEIRHIKDYDSYRNGLNSTYGGDGLGKHDLSLITPEEMDEIRANLGGHFKNYNKNVKWANTTEEDRKLLTKHLHTEDIYKQKSESLKKFYEENPDIAKSKYDIIQKWQSENIEKFTEIARTNGLIGAKKVSKKIKVESKDGTITYYESKSEFTRQTGQYANYIMKKTNEGSFHNGLKVWEENE